MNHGSSKQETRLFTLRMWQEETGDGQREWRGKVQALPEGEANNFRDPPGDWASGRDVETGRKAQNHNQLQEVTVSVESTQATMMRYFNSKHGDVSMMAEDVVFTTMETGEGAPWSRWCHGDVDLLLPRRL